MLRSLGQGLLNHHPFTNSVVDCVNILSYDNLATGDDALANIANNDICFSLHILSNSHSKFTQIK